MQSLSSLSRQSKAETPLSFWKTLWGRFARIGLNSPFFIRLRHWEYWPFAVVYFPVFFYYLWLSIKARSPFFFSTSNPSIETGGLLGESKADILARISDEFKPQTWLVSASATVAEVLALVADNKISYPLIAKPDVGERGWRVEKIESQAGLVAYLNSSPGDFLIQEYVDEPLDARAVAGSGFVHCAEGVPEHPGQRSE
jgi:hypothetical protein